jgi:hypothetical protein
MSHRQWAERVGDELVRRGVPARFRRRLLAELRDHADDLKDEEDLTMTDEVLNERLGAPAALAAGAAEEYRRARWTSRHPLVVFGLLPLPATLLVFAATVFALALAVYVVGWVTAGDVSDLPRPALVVLTSAMAWAVRFLPFGVLALLFTRLYVRSRVSRWWLVTAAAQVLVVAGSTISMINYRDEPGQSQYILGFALAPSPGGDGWTLPFLSLVGWSQVMQVIVPVAVGTFMYRAAHRRRAALAVNG